MAIKITISPDLLAFQPRAMQKLAIGKQGVASYLETQIKQQIRTVDAVASGSLLNDVRRLPSESNVIRVGSDKIQAQFVEEGRPPGKVPRWSEFKPILQAWAKAKGLSIPENALYPIALKIREKGFKGRFPFKKAAESATPGALRILSNSLEGL